MVCVRRVPKRRAVKKFYVNIPKEKEEKRKSIFKFLVHLSLLQLKRKKDFSFLSYITVFLQFHSTVPQL